MMYALFYRSIIYYYRNHIYWMDLWIMRIARTLDMCLWRCWCSGPMQWYWTNQWTDGPSYTSSIRQRAITGTHATMQTCRRCLTMFRVESATLIQGSYELLLFVHCTLKSVTSHKSKIKIHLQLFLDFNVEQCRVRLKWLNKLIPTKIGTCACVWKA